MSSGGDGFEKSDPSPSQHFIIDPFGYDNVLYQAVKVAGSHLIKQSGCPQWERQQPQGGDREDQGSGTEQEYDLPMVS